MEDVTPFFEKQDLTVVQNRSEATEPTGEVRIIQGSTQLVL